MSQRQAVGKRAGTMRLHAISPLIRVAALMAVSLTSAAQVLAYENIEPPPSAAIIPSRPPAAVTSKLTRYAARIVERHDTNRDGHLDAQEWKTMQGQPDVADTNRDGQLTVEEFARHLAAYGSGRRIRLSSAANLAENQSAAETSEASPEAMNSAVSTDAVESRRETKYVAPIASGTPGWFVERDSDGDGQLTLSEFSPRLRAPEVAEFNRYDSNGDGLLTPAELARATSKTPAAPATSP